MPWLSVLLWLAFAAPPNPAMAAEVGVQWRLGPTDPQGRQDRLGLELVDVDLQPIWFHPMAASELQGPLALEPKEVRENGVHLRVQKYFDECMPRYRPRERLPRTWLTLITRSQVVVADEVGVRAYRRRDGKELMHWDAPAARPGWPGPPTRPLQFLVQHGSTDGCSALLEDRTHASACGDDAVVWFDGSTVALFEVDPLRKIGSRRIEPKAVRRDQMSDFLRVRVQGWRVELESTLP